MLDAADDFAPRPYTESEPIIDAFVTAVRNAICVAYSDGGADGYPDAYADQCAEHVADELGRAYRCVYGSGAPSADRPAYAGNVSQIDARNGGRAAFVVNGYAYAVDPEADRRPDPRTNTID